jgi:carbon starvation protein CstA
MLGEYLHLDMTKMKTKLAIAIPVFAIVAVILFWAKYSPMGFTILWRYFSWANQTIAIFAFATFTIYLYGHRKSNAWLMSLIPGLFYCFVICAFILNAQIGFRLAWTPTYIIAGALTIGYGALVLRAGKKARANASLDTMSVA